MDDFDVGLTGDMIDESRGILKVLVYLTNEGFGEVLQVRGEMVKPRPRPIYPSSDSSHWLAMAR